MTKTRIGRRTLLGGLIGISLLFAPLGAVNAQQTPEDIVGEFHQALLATMQEAKTLGFGGRYARLEPAITKSFHLPLMVQVATGSFWRKASPAQHDRLIAEFTKISVGTYASRFSGFSGQSFETRGVRPGPQKTQLVDTILRNPSDKDVSLTYVTREIKGAWRIIDVLLDTGISELAVRRSEYRRILKSDGIDGLIGQLTQKAADLTARR